MKHATMFGLFMCAAASLMTFATHAAATEGSTGTKSSTGTTLEVNDAIHVVSVSNTVLDGLVKVTCASSTVQGTVRNGGSWVETLGINVLSMTFSSCGANTVTVFAGGTLELHTEVSDLDDGDGTITSSGLTITVLTHNILGTIHCTYTTNNTDLGTLDGSNHTGGTATVTVESVGMLQEITDPGCSNNAELTGEYTMTTPDYLYIH